MNSLPQFNLWIEPWIRVIRSDYRDDEVSIHDCLLQAHELIALSDPSPLVVGGTHRLLAAILQAIYQPTSLNDIANVLQAKKFDAGNITAFEQQHGSRFDLFDPKAPFLQTGDVPLDGWKKPAKGQKNNWGDPQPIARLFAEVPVATERTHFYHVTDDDHYYCPACCARGLVTVPAFASSGGAGIRPSINGVPPVYVFPAGDTLFETLALSLVSDAYQPRTAEPKRKHVSIWSTNPSIVAKDHEVSAVGYLESLTFPARRMRLYPHIGELVCCTNCGRNTNVYVRDLLYEKGHWLSKKIGVWDDPFVAFRQKKDEIQGVRLEKGKALWREYTNLLLQADNTAKRPLIIEQIVRLIDHGYLNEHQLVRFRCIGIRTDGKAKIFEWLDEALEVPPALLVNVDTAEYVAEALQRATEIANILGNTFNYHFKPERGAGGFKQQDLVRFKSVRERMIADYWRALGLRFRKFIDDLARAQPDERDGAAKDWVQIIVKLARECFDAALDQIGNRADELRARVKAKHESDYQLYTKQKEWLNE